MRIIFFFCGYKICMYTLQSALCDHRLAYGWKIINQLSCIVSTRLCFKCFDMNFAASWGEIDISLSFKMFKKAMKRGLWLKGTELNEKINIRTVSELNNIIVNTDLYKKWPNSDNKCDQFNYRRMQKRSSNANRVREN